MQYPIVLHERAAVDPAKQFEYDAKYKELQKVRSQYQTLVESVNTICEIYAAKPQCQLVMDRIKDLRNQIRIHTKGTPTGYSLDAERATLAIARNSGAQNDNARKVLLKSVFKKLAQILHPDKPTGDIEMFDMVRDAYAQGDLTFLQEMYIDLQQKYDVYYKQTKGLKYIKVELERPKVALARLKNSPLYRIAQMHHQKKYDEATFMTFNHLCGVHDELEIELFTLLTKYQEKQDGKGQEQGQKGKEIIVGGFDEADEEGQREGNVEDERQTECWQEGFPGEGPGQEIQGQSQEGDADLEGT